MKNWDRQSDERVMGEASLWRKDEFGSLILQFPHVLTNPACVALSDNVHRCVALKTNSVQRTVKFTLKAQNILMFQFTMSHEASPKSSAVLDILYKMYLEKLNFSLATALMQESLFQSKRVVSVQ